MHSNSLNNHLLNLHQGITFWWKHKTKWRSWPKQWQHFNQYPHPDRSQHEIEWNLTVCTQWISPKNWSQSVLLLPVLLTVALIVTFHEMKIIKSWIFVFNQSQGKNYYLLFLKTFNVHCYKKIMPFNPFITYVITFRNLSVNGMGPL